MSILRLGARAAMVLVVAVAAVFLLGPAVEAGNDSGQEAHVVKVIHEGYFNGAFNEQNTDAMARSFHQDFAIFSAKGEELARYEIATWIDGIKKRRARSDFDPASTVYEGKVTVLDVTGGAASAKVELRKDGKLVYTDYLSLLKFDSGWKIVAKVYHRH
ncbi:MAG: nuclear transport factor 2 family protein [Phycisphaerae bacterium]